jgi:hypothetical protein
MQTVDINILIAPLKSVNLLFELCVLKTDGLYFLDRAEVSQEMIQALLDEAKLDALLLSFIDYCLII